MEVPLGGRTAALSIRSLTQLLNAGASTSGRWALAIDVMTALSRSTRAGSRLSTNCSAEKPSTPTDVLMYGLFAAKIR